MTIELSGTAHDPKARWDGRLCKLVDEDGNTVLPGDTVTSFRGKTATLKGGRAPHKPGSQGKVYLQGGGEFYPSVYGLRWVLS